MFGCYWKTALSLHPLSHQNEVIKESEKEYNDMMQARRPAAFGPAGRRNKKS